MERNLHQAGTAINRRTGTGWPVIGVKIPSDVDQSNLSSTITKLLMTWKNCLRSGAGIWRCTLWVARVGS